MFLIAPMVFEKFDEKVYDMKHCRAMDGFYQTRSEKPNVPTIPSIITIFRILTIFTYFDTLITNIMYQMYH